MPRASYYAPVGNPTIPDKIPKHSLDFEFVYCGDSLETTQKLRTEAICRIIVVDLIVMVLSYYSGALAYGYLGFVGVSYFLYWANESLDCGENRSFIRPTCVFLLTGLVILLGLHVPELLIAVMAILLSLHTYAIGKHWIHRCTISPLERDKARQLRAQWMGHLRIVVVVPIAAVVAAFYFDRHWLFPVLLLAFGLIQLVLCREPLSVFRTGWRTFSSWLAYNVDNVQSPGLSQSPVGSAKGRQLRLIGDSLAFVTLCAMHSVATTPQPDMSFAVLFVVPGLSFVFISLLIQAPLLEDASRILSQTLQQSGWETTLNEMRSSENPELRNSYFMGHVNSDGSPFFVSRDVFDEPSHFLGSTGAGKTSKGLAPMLEQTIGFADSTVLGLDPKADSLESFATIMTAREKVYARTGKLMPLKVFSTQNHLPMHGFNPFSVKNWHNFNTYQQTDILCGALGLAYGPNYGESHFQAAMSEVLNATLKGFPPVRSFSELAERLQYVLSNPEQFGVLPTTARNADHLYAEVKRLSDFEQLQIGNDGRFSDDALENQIDLTEFFQKPQLAYIHLSSTLGAGSAPVIARLFIYMLLTAATQTERKCRVYLVIDEFQRIVADNLEYILQLARSMGVSVVLANQSMADLYSGRKDLTSTLETNCRFRQWFDVPSEEDRRRLMSVAGETIETLQTTSTTIGTDSSSRTTSAAEVILPRININEILQVGDDPQLSIVRISRGAGYAQFGGMPTVIRSDFHITEEEFEARKAMPWPEGLPGTFIPSQLQTSAPSTTPTNGPTIVTDVREDTKKKNPKKPSASDLLSDLNNPPEKKPRKRKGSEDEPAQPD